ncbi:MAG: methylated-DNA--[protein]-cysteine S-methyltransferase [Desulfamplus sp.]|nr:methylated-DNA--[protein]-cysteine S-methyltransferase [Desulfamplus sp.]
MYTFCYINTVLGELLAVNGENGLTELSLPCNGTRALPGPGWIYHREPFDALVKELDAYFNNRLSSFSIPVAPRGTPFQLSVWSALLTIPWGRTVTYKEIAERIGSPRAYRAVGGAAGKNPIPIIIPCHRVIGSNGSLTGFSSGIAVKKFLLELEGI